MNIVTDCFFDKVMSNHPVADNDNVRFGCVRGAHAGILLDSVFRLDIAPWSLLLHLHKPRIPVHFARHLRFESTKQS
jgi:hypothetical protein